MEAPGAALLSTLAVGLVFTFLGGAATCALRLPPLAGYLLAGVAVSPFAPGFVADRRIAPELVEIGVSSPRALEDREQLDTPQDRRGAGRPQRAFVAHDAVPASPAPDIVQASIDRRLPRGIGLIRLPTAAVLGQAARRSRPERTSPTEAASPVGTRSRKAAKARSG